MKAMTLPDLTDVNRICKEGNVNQYYFQTYAEFFIACEVVVPPGKSAFIDDGQARV